MLEERRFCKFCRKCIDYRPHNAIYCKGCSEEARKMQDREKKRWKRELDEDYQKKEKEIIRFLKKSRLELNKPTDNLVKNLCLKFELNPKDREHIGVIYRALSKMGLKRYKTVEESIGESLGRVN